jgi:brefeldin A-inhibited guanine nucleotide-exchange protein
VSQTVQKKLDLSFDGFSPVSFRLRHFLTNCGFRLPGEAQRIDRIMSTFAKCYFEDNAGDALRCPFKYEDTVYLVAFAIIMLNTDLHSSATKTRKKMTKNEFIGNLRGAEQGEDVSKEYLSKIFESIESNPIALDSNSSPSLEVRPTDIQDILNNVRSADTLLRGLAVHDFQFATIEDFGDGLDYKPTEALADLTRCCVSKTWHQWHGVVNTCLETAHLDPLGMAPSLEILLYGLVLTVCLDMPTERAAFLSQLGRLKAFEDRRQGRYVTAGEPDESIGDWFRELEQGCCGSEQRKLQSLQQIRDWITAFKSDLMNDAQNKITMQAVVRQLKDCENLLQDPARAFHRAGNLVKKSARTGRSTTYRFYLFSDVLLYAKEDPDGRFVVHEELPLHLLKIIDWFPPSQKNRKVMFEVVHPRKSFFVLCSSSKERKSWVKDIKAAVQLDVDRMVKMEAARVAARR